MTTSVRSSRDIILRTDRWVEAVVFFETVAFCLYVEKGAPHEPVLDFLTPDVSAVRDRLLAAGCQLIEESASVPRCYLRDPFGLTFNLGTAASGREACATQRKSSVPPRYSTAP